MSKHQFIELFASIKKSFVSFLAIVLLLSCGSGIYVGFDFTKNCLKQTANEQFNEGNFHDLEIYFPYGISEEELSKLNELEDVDEIEGQYYGYESFENNGKLLQAKIVSITNNIDTFVQIQGRLPINDNEVVIDANAAKEYDLKIGDKITLNHNNSQTAYLISQVKNNETSSIDIEKEIYYLKEKTLQVVGLATSPEYYSVSSASYGVSAYNALQIDIILFVNYEQFNQEIVSGYNSVLIRSNKLRNLDSFSSEYQNLSSELLNEVKGLAKEISKDNYLTFKSNYDDFLSDYKKELDEAKNELLTYEDEYNKTVNKLIEAQKEIDEAKSKIEENEDLLNESKILLDENKIKLDEAENNLKEYKNQIAEPYQEYQDGLNEFAQFKEYYATALNYNNEALSSLEKGLSLSYFEFMAFCNSYMQDLLDVFFNEDSLEILYGFIKEIDINKYQEIQNNVSTYKTNYGTYSALLFVQYPYNSIFDFYQKLYEFESSLIKESQNYYASYVDDCENKLNEAYEQLSPYLNQITSYEKQFNDSKNLYDNKYQEYEDGLKGLEEAKIQVNENQNKVDEVNKQANEALKLLNQNKEEYNVQENNYLKLKNDSVISDDYGSLYLLRSENAICIYNKLEFEAIGNIKNILGGLFLIIAIFVCYGVIVRRINDERKLIGTKKALGFSNWQISLSYLSYNALACILGFVLGIIIAYFLVEALLAPLITEQVYTYKVVGNYFDLKILIKLFIGEFIFVELVTILAMYKTLKLSAIDLLQGHIIKNKVNKHLSLKGLSTFKQTILSNTINDPSRVFFSLVAIAGSLALIVSSLSLRNNVLSSFDVQYRECYLFDSIVLYDNQVGLAKQEIEELFKENKLDYCEIYFTNGYCYSENSKKLLTRLIVFDNQEEFSHFVSLKSCLSNEYDYQGIWYPESIQKYYDYDLNQNITYETFTGDKATSEVSGYYELYSYNLVCFMDYDTYLKEFGKELKNNAFMINTTNVDTDKLNQALRKIDGYSQTYEYYELDYLDAQVYRIIAKAVVAVYLVVSILMAFFVLLNLLLTYVQEKKKEIIVLMINGYSLKQAELYIRVDTYVLLVIGLIIGTVIGVYAGKIALRAFDSEYVYLNNSINFVACLLGISITIILTLIMVEISCHKLKKFKCYEVND